MLARGLLMDNSNFSPLISVIIPVYNGEKYLSEAVESLLNQPCKDLEIIIVNDGSKDNTDIICKNLAGQYDNINYINKENGGVSSARNLGIQNAKGKYISFLDSDDVWTKNFYSEELHNKIINDGSDMFSFGFIMSDEKMRNGTYYPAIDNQKHKINKYNHLCSCFYSSENVCKYLEFDTNKKFREDVLYLLRAICVAKNICCIDKYIFVYRDNPTSVMHTCRDTSVESILDEAIFWKCDVLDWILKNTKYYDSDNIAISKTMALTYAFEYVKTAGLNNYSFNKIKNRLNQYISDEELKNPDELYLNDIARYTQQRYFSDPDKYISELNKESFKSKVVTFAREALSNFFLVRWLYHKQKYTNDISRYVCNDK